MAYTYDINTSKRDNLSSSCLFACHTLTTFVTIFCSTFMIAYIYQFATDTFDYIFKVGIFQICVYVTFLLTYWLFSYFTDKTNRVLMFRIAQIFRLLFLIAMIFWGKELAQMLYLAGFLYGLGESSYYASYNVLKQEMVSRKVMNKFSIMITIFMRMADIVVPVSLGAIIHVTTYEYTSIYVSAIVGIIFILSFFIRAKKPESSCFSLKNYFAKLQKQPDEYKKMKFLYVSSLVYGFTTMTNNLLNVCVMLIFNSTLSLGSITSVIGVVTIIELILVTKFTKAGRRDWVYWLSIVMPLASSIVFVVHPSMVTVILFNLFMLMSKIIFSAIFDIYRNTTLKEAGLYSEIAEHQTMIESLLTFTRIVSFAIMILVGWLRNLVVYEILLVVFSLAYSAINFCMLLYERKFIRTKDVTPIQKEK